jgi:hypothetical protein
LKSDYFSIPSRFLILSKGIAPTLIPVEAINKIATLPLSCLFDLLSLTFFEFPDGVGSIFFVSL